MSYAPVRPSSTTPQPPHQPLHSHSGDSNGPPRSAQQHAASPLDWANFINFQTPPLHTSRSYGNASQQGGDRGRQDEQYSAFAQGIAMSRPSPQNINFQHPYPSTPPSRSKHQNPPESQYVPNPSPLQRRIQLSPQRNAMHRSPSSGGPSPVEQYTSVKGKSVSRSSSNSTPQPQQNPSIINQSDLNNPDDGLTLDPAAFSRDIRFQIPPFLSNQIGGVPTFPPGGQAWSGFSGANFFSSDCQTQLTPGQLFGQTFDGQQPFQPNEPPHINPLDELSGFMAGDEGWESWNNGDPKDTSSMATTFYVNPNPSSNVLAPRNQQSIQQRTPIQTRPGLPQLNLNAQHTNNVTQSPRTAITTQPGPIPSPQVGKSAERQTTLPSPRTSTSTNSMQTSAILPQHGHTAFPSASAAPTFPFVPSTYQGSATTINIASSSTAPYAPPSNTQALLQGPGVVGPSLADGPGLYSTTGFDMVGVLSRVAARKDPKTVLGPVDLSCSFLVVVSTILVGLVNAHRFLGYTEI